MKEVLWLNKETLEERWLHPYLSFNNLNIWVEVPDGATFATGDKDNFVFRKDGWYYEDGEWVETNVLLKHSPEYKYIKLFWVKSDVKDNVFTLERLLGCEVYSTGDIFHINEVFLSAVTKLAEEDKVMVDSYLSKLIFFTEDGDELTFDEYVEMYYPCG